MSLEKIQRMVTQDIDAVAKEMYKAAYSEVPLIREMSQHIFQGGKRIRPLLIILMSYTIHSAQAEHIVLAGIIEFIHTATLLHDDVIDNSSLRRGAVTANQLWGNEASVLVGDFLYSRAFQQLVTLKNHTLMQILSETMNIMAEGEVLQLMSRHDSSITEETYFKIIHAKTAILFEAACTMTLTVAQQNKSSMEAAAKFGCHLGFMFQLVDDALDYSGDAQQLGKNIGDDLAEGKMTLPLIHALAHATPIEQALISHTVATGELTQLIQIQHILDKYRSVDYTFHQAQQHRQQALSALAFFPDSQYKEALLELTHFLLERTY